MADLQTTGPDSAASGNGMDRSVDWPDNLSETINRKNFVAKHNGHHSPLFSDEALIDLIDNYPRERLQVFTMGDSPEAEDATDWTPVDTTGASGQDIWNAVHVGKLWVKLMRLDLTSPEYHGLVAPAYENIAGTLGEPVHSIRPLMLISSPKAFVYYHADGYPTMLWQYRGVKRVWVYPANDPNFIDPSDMEQIIAGRMDEEVHYRPDFDQHAFVHDLEPGELVSWPMNGPHRVTNLDSVNVSIAVPYITDTSERRRHVFSANRWLRRLPGVHNPSIREDGMASFIKRTAYRASVRLGLLREMVQGREYITSLRLDGASKTGVRQLTDGPVRTPF